MYPQSQVTFVQEQPATFASSAEARRGFCARCGTPICFTATFLPGLIDITIGSLDSPETLPPTLHYWESKRLPWLHLADELPRYAEFPP
jgi:hypothetical protein